MDINPLDITQIVVQLIASTGAIIIGIIDHRSKKIIGEREKSLEESTNEKKETNNLPDDTQKIQDEKIELEVIKLRSKRLSILMWIIIAITIINIGIFIRRSFNSEKTTQIFLTYPINLSEVDQKETIRGSAVNLPPNYKMILVVFNPVVERYYPQDQNFSIEADNKWSSLVLIGSDQDVGKKFDIIVLNANEKATGFFESYFLGSKNSGSWVGMNQLPEGAIIYDRITVTRK